MIIIMISSGHQAGPQYVQPRSMRTCEMREHKDLVMGHECKHKRRRKELGASWDAPRQSNPIAA